MTLLPIDDEEVVEESCWTRRNESGIREYGGYSGGAERELFDGLPVD